MKKKTVLLVKQYNIVSLYVSDSDSNLFFTMGYDSDECIICYTTGRGNNPVGIMSKICFGCLDRHMAVVYGRVASEVQYQSRFICGDCPFCRREDKLLITVCLCDICKSRIKMDPVPVPQSSDDEDDEDSSGEDENSNEQNLAVE